MQCIRCGKEMENTTGGNYHCPSCSFAVNDLVYRPSEWKPFPQSVSKQEGWICPVCGRGVAPWVDVCPCQGSEMQITYGTSLDTEEIDSIQDYYEQWIKQHNTNFDGELKL
jgi:predicted amidophosphoribosyltransferase